MADKVNTDRDEPATGAANDEQIRGVADDEDVDAAEELDEDEIEDEESGSTI